MLQIKNFDKENIETNTTNKLLYNISLLLDVMIDEIRANNSLMRKQTATKTVCDACGKIFKTLHALNAHRQFCKGGSRNGEDTD